jgi:anaerobic magnesium-protoporphyrin IX monomethyl ester cyclase
MLRFALVVPNLHYNNDTYLWSILPSRGLLSIASILRDEGHFVSYIDADVDHLTEQQVIAELKTVEANVVGITMNTFQAKACFDLAILIKKECPNIIIIVGGPHPSALKAEIIEKWAAVDIVCVGESEHTIRDLSRILASGGNLNLVKGIIFRDQDGIHLTGEPTAIKDLDSIPFPAFELAGNLNRYPGAQPTKQCPSMHIMASRGCPFDCVFCTKSVWGKHTRFRTPGNIVDEIEWLHNKFGINEIFFQDDTLNLNRDWFFSVCEEIKHRGLNHLSYKAPFRVNERLVDEELLTLAKETGFWIIFYGVESGNQRILDATKKGTTIDEIKRAFMLTKKAGLQTIAAFMVGNVGENHDTITDSINLAIELKPEYWGFSIATPLPGTEFHKIAVNNNWILNHDFMHWSQFKAVSRIDQLTAEEITLEQRRATTTVAESLQQQKSTR